MQARGSAHFTRSSTRWLALVPVVFACVWLATLATRKLLNPDEARYAEIPREMVVTGDWVTPRLNDLKYFEKPPLQYWATAAAYQTLGISEFASRLWTGVTGLAGIALTVWFGIKLFGRWTGVAAGALLASSWMYFILGHVNTLDMGLSFFLLAACGCFLLAQDAPPNSASARAYMWCAWVSAALAVLSKGPVALVLPALTLIIYSAIERDFSAWRRLHWATGCGLFALIVAPWFIAVSLANPEFPEFFFLHEHVQRFLTDVHRRTEPWWYFLPLLVAGALPWAFLAIPAVPTQWRLDRAASAGFKARRFLIIWIAVVVGFFSLSHSKLPPYILPALPAIALLTADFVVHRRNIRAHLLAIALGWLMALAYLTFGPAISKENISGISLQSLTRAAQLMTLLGAVGALSGWWWANRKRNFNPARNARAVVCMALGTFLGLSALLVRFDIAREVRSGFDLAQQVKGHLRADTQLYSVASYNQSLPFYLQRPLTLVGYSGETDFGLRQEPDKGLTDLDTFLSGWQSNPPGTVAFMPQSLFAQLALTGMPMRVVGSNWELVAIQKPLRSGSPDLADRVKASR